MRILVTGAGLLGAHAAAELRRAGHEVAVVDVRPDPRYLATVAGPAPPPVYRLDVRNVAGLTDLLRQWRAEAVVHSAGLLGDKANRHPYLAFEVNASATAAVAEAARGAEATRLVHLSSLAVYDWRAGTAASTVDEAFPTAPRTPYAASKLAGELVVRCYAARGWLEASVLRLAGAYGPGLFRGGALLGDALQRAVARAAAGDPVTVSPRLAGHEYLHAGDAASAIRLVLELGRSGVYNVGTGRVHSAAQVAAALRAALPGSAVTAVEPAGPLPPVLDTGALRRAVPGWRCRELAAGLAELVAALRAHPWLAAPGDAGDPAARAEPAVRVRAAAAPAGAHAVEAKEG